MHFDSPEFEEVENQIRPWFICCLHEIGEKLTLIAAGPDRNDVEKHTWNWLQKNEPESSCQVLTVTVVESIEVGDFIMRGPTP